MLHSSYLYYSTRYSWSKTALILFRRELVAAAVVVVVAAVAKPPCVEVKLTGGDGYVMTTEVSEIWCQHLSALRELVSPITILALT